MKLLYTVKLFFTFLTIIFFSCEEATQKSIVDNSPPQCVILYPADGQSISGEIVIQARAVDNLGIEYVEFYINQEKVHVDSSSNDNDYILTDGIPSHPPLCKTLTKHTLKTSITLFQ